jgi:hypothetical protein
MHHQHVQLRHLQRRDERRGTTGILAVARGQHSERGCCPAPALRRQKTVCVVDLHGEPSGARSRNASDAACSQGDTDRPARRAPSRRQRPQRQPRCGRTAAAGLPAALIRNFKGVYTAVPLHTCGIPADSGRRSTRGHDAGLRRKPGRPARHGTARRPSFSL